MARSKTKKLEKKMEEKQQQQQQQEQQEQQKTPPTRRKTKPKNPSKFNVINELSDFKYRLEKIKKHQKYCLEHRLTVTDGEILPQHNKHLYMYEESLLKLLIKLDSVQVDNQVERDCRKRVVDLIQQELNEVDQYKKDPKSKDLPVYVKKVEQDTTWIIKLGIFWLNI